MMHVKAFGLMRLLPATAAALLGASLTMAQAQNPRLDLPRGRAAAASPVVAQQADGDRTARPAQGVRSEQASGRKSTGAPRQQATREQALAAAPMAQAAGAGAMGLGGGVLASVASALGLGVVFHQLGLTAPTADLATVAVLALLLGLLGWGSWRLLRRVAMGGAAAAAGRMTTARRQAVPRSSFAASGYEPMALAPESSVHYGQGGIEELAARTGEFRWGVPQGFDAAGFVQEAKRNFVVLQEAWDASDLARLRALMTDELLANIQAQLQERGNRPNRTDVVTLHAELLGVEVVAGNYLANVEFSGMIREEISAGASPFREIWSLTKPCDGSSGWLLASVQALQ